MAPIVQNITAHVLRDESLVGYRIAILGDFHLAPWRSVRALCAAVRLINEAQPDLVALVGDYGYSLEHSRAASRWLYQRVLPRIVPELASIRSRDGTYAVLGNHDVDAGDELVRDALASSGIRVLSNTYHDIVRAGATLRVFGVKDLTRSRRQSLKIELPVAQESAATLVLSHHPDLVRHVVPLAQSAPVVVVAGHTHGGQITLPMVGAPITLSRAASHRFPAGFVPNETSTLYVTRGVGEQIPIRIRAAREVAILKLARR